MKRFMLATTALGAVIAFAAAAPAFAGGSGSGDDSATIVQTLETSGFAWQHQPGDFGNSATIVQTQGTGDVATQEQWRNLDGNDFAIDSTQVITQTLNNGAVAQQEDNGEGFDVQTANQVFTTNTTTALQTINVEFGEENHQASDQEFDSASLVSQTIGASAPGFGSDFANTQVATQLSQANSSITQLEDGGNFNTEVALQDPGSFNTISATITAASNSNLINQTQMGSDLTEVALITAGSNNNSITQLQGVGSSFESQVATIVGSSNNVVDQLQDADSAFNTQVVNIAGGSDDGRALQYQGVGVEDGTQVITQTGPAFNNQAGQSQGNNFNVATITQTGGSNNVALQNQGTLPGQTGYMAVSGGVVVRTP